MPAQGLCYNEREVIKMEEKRESHKRKELRIKQFDYSSKGAYFVTICVQDRKRILSEILSQIPGNLIFVPMTIRSDSLSRRLLNNGLIYK